MLDRYNERHVGIISKVKGLVAVIIIIAPILSLGKLHRPKAASVVAAVKAQKGRVAGKFE